MKLFDAYESATIAGFTLKLKKVAITIAIALLLLTSAQTILIVKWIFVLYRFPQTKVILQKIGSIVRN
jgi:hypothetical protein